MDTMVPGGIEYKAVTVYTSVSGSHVLIADRIAVRDNRTARMRRLTKTGNELEWVIEGTEYELIDVGFNMKDMEHNEKLENLSDYLYVQNLEQFPDVVFLYKKTENSILPVGYGYSDMAEIRVRDLEIWLMCAHDYETKRKDLMAVNVLDRLKTNALEA